MLVKIWFGLLLTILVATLGVLVAGFDVLSVFDWIAFLALTWTIGLTAYMYLEQPHKKEIKELQRTYEQFIKKKDKEMEELRSKSDLWFKTALKRSDENIELAELKRRLEEKTSVEEK